MVFVDLSRDILWGHANSLGLFLPSELRQGLWSPSPPTLLSARGWGRGTVPRGLWVWSWTRSAMPTETEWRRLPPDRSRHRLSWQPSRWCHLMGRQEACTRGLSMAGRLWGVPFIPHTKVGTVTLRLALTHSNKPGVTLASLFTLTFVAHANWWTILENEQKYTLLTDNG